MAITSSAAPKDHHDAENQPSSTLSASTVVSICHALSRAAQRARGRSDSLGEEWQGVRPQHAPVHGPQREPSSQAGRHEHHNTIARPESITESPVVAEPASYDSLQGVPPDAVSGNDGGYASDSSEDSHSGDEYKIKKASQPRESRRQLPALSAQQRGIIKCSIAYGLATLFTFTPLSGLIAAPFDLEGPIRGGHVIATVATYFNPAKTLGAMFEADIFMLWASLFAFIVAIASMASATLLNMFDLHVTSHAVSVLWLMFSMGLLAFLKVKVSHAQFGSACSMVALILTSVICKEASVHNGDFQLGTIGQTFATVFLGAAISNIVCVLLWRGSATSKLQGDINKTLEGFSTLLDLLCSTFINEDSRASQKAIKNAIEAHRASFVALKSSLDAAKLELWDHRIQRTQKAYDALIATMNRLAQDITGLRTAIAIKSDLERLHSETLRASDKEPASVPGDSEDILDSFQAHVGPSLMKLADVLRSNLRILRTSFAESRAGKKAHPHHHYEFEEAAEAESRDMHSNLDVALQSYKVAHTKAIRKLYRHLTKTNARNGVASSIKSHRSVDTAPNDEVFLIYFYCFNLEEFAREQAILIDNFAAIRREEALLAREHRLYADRFGKRLGKVMDFLDVFGFLLSESHVHAKTHRFATLTNKIVQLMPFAGDKQESLFPATGDAAVTSYSAVQEKTASILGRVRRRIWKVAVSWKRPDIIFAIKSGIGCGLLGSLAFDHRTRPTFVQYSGNWALLSYMVVVAVTTGQTQFNSFFRIGGTVLGACTAVIAWAVLFGHPLLLFIFSYLMSLPCFALIITKPKFATTGRFILLSYNLTALYAYNVRHSDYDVEEIAFHRIVAVTVGTLWALFVTRFLFPFEARRELRAGTSELLLKYAYYYQRLTETVSNGHAISSKLVDNDGNLPSERTPLLSDALLAASLASRDEIFVAMEMEMQIDLIKLKALLDNAHHEPRLKGPFPSEAYSVILTSCQRILDILHSIRSVAVRPEFSDIIRRYFMAPSNHERREVCGNILLFLTLLASGLSLKAPLSPYLPPAEEARRALVAKISSLSVVRRRSIRGTSPYLLYYSYSLMEKELVAQLESLGRVFQYLFGVNGDVTGSGDGVTAFEALFEDGEGGSDAGHDSADDSESSTSGSRHDH